MGVAVQPGALADSAAYRDTIGAFTYYEGMAPMRVRGHGLVVGLGTNGSRDCPKKVFDQLVQAMYKRRRATGRVVGVEEITPERLISDVDTAVVIVRGDIPPAAVRGSDFDITVTALPGTETKSLRGGRLYSAELRVFKSTATGRPLSGRVLAQASGPVFLNPFSNDEAATKSNPLQGTVLGGGIVMEDRRIRLVLTSASHLWARRIQDRINAHFPGSHRLANAISPSFIDLHVPPKYHGDEGHFLALVRSLYTSRDPRFEAARARMLAEEILRPTAPHARIALAFEGLGRAGLPELGDLYAHHKDYVRFHAAVAGLRLGEHIAGDAIALCAQDAASRYRFQAIRALGEAVKVGGTAVTLRRLLKDDDARVQIAAYEALIKRHDPAIQSRRVGRDNFILDEVSASPTALIYVKRSGVRRMALFGRAPACTPPTFYRAADGTLTITADPGDEGLTLLRIVLPSGATSPPILAPFDLPALIQLLGNNAGVDLDGRVSGLGLDYGAVVAALYNLSRKGSLDAKLILEQPSAAELFGPPRPPGRPESEL
jgi:flagellar basal body P-ring protein FlgI